MKETNLSNVIFSTIPIPDLIDRIANEMDRRAALTPKAAPDATPSNPKPLYGDKAAAEHIGCSPQLIGKLRKSDKILFHTTGTRYYYYAHELDQDLLGKKNRFGELRGRRAK